MLRFKKTLAAGLLAAAFGTGAAWGGFCGAYQDKHTTFVEARPGESLPSVVGKAASGTTILLHPGTYKVSSIIQFLKPDVTLRSRTGRREDVILDGNLGGTPLDRTRFVSEIIAVRASGVALVDLTVRYAKYHGVHVFPSGSAHINGFLMHNVRVYDTGEQLVKVNSSGGSAPGWADYGVVQCSVLEFVDNSVMKPMGSDFYTGGLDVHGGLDWKVRHNLFRNIQRNGRSMEHAVHFWSRSRGTVVENNRFEDNYRAIGFGMKTSLSGPERKYPDGAGTSPYLDHIGGIIRNNTVWNRKGIRLETGIALWNARDAEVYHNTVWSGDAPFSGIEYRFANTRAVIMNNLAGHRILKRDNASATLGSNAEYAPASSFRNAAAGDLHLAAGSLPSIVDRGATLAAGKAGVDMDEQARTGAPDIGADERIVAAAKEGASVPADSAGGASLEPSPGGAIRDAAGREMKGRRSRRSGVAAPEFSL